MPSITELFGGQVNINDLGLPDGQVLEVKILGQGGKMQVQESASAEYYNIHYIAVFTVSS